ncbi:MAG: STAS domain-containing protein [Spirochaetales bacterium]|nr:STAS domain-containing protein [Spirochaetales bacterium]
MEVNYSQEGSRIRVAVDGNIDSDGAGKLSDILQKIMTIDNVENVEFDLLSVFSTTSSGIGKLLNFYKYIDSHGGSMEISAISESLYKQFIDIHLDRIFTIRLK